MIIDLSDVECKIDSWIYSNTPVAAVFVDYSALFPEILEVAFGLTSRKDFKRNDVLGLSNWGMPTTVRENLCELMIGCMEDALLRCLGERPTHGWYKYKLINSRTLVVVEVII